jgi:hypothetical protein
MTTVEVDVITGRLAFLAATTSPFSTAAATVTTLLVWLSVTIPGWRQALLLLHLLQVSEPMLLGEKKLAITGDGVGGLRFITVIHRLEPIDHLLDEQGREV